MTEARELAGSRLTMHRIGDKSAEEYRDKIQSDLDLLGGFFEDEEGVAIVAALAEDDWYEEYLKKNWAGHPEYAGNGVEYGKEAEH